MAIEIKQMQIKTTVDNRKENKNATNEKLLCENLEKIKNDILKESLKNTVEYFNRQKER